MITCHQICHILAPSRRAASTMSLGTVDRPARKISTPMPKVDHDWMARVTGSAVAERPSQSTPGMPDAS